MADVRVFQGKLSEIYLLRDFLLGRGLPVELRGEALSGLHGAIPIPDAMPSLWVPEDRETEARIAIAAWEGPALVHPEWTCARCGETNPPSFQLCWSCETPRE